MSGHKKYKCLTLEQVRKMEKGSARSTESQVASKFIPQVDRMVKIAVTFGHSSTSFRVPEYSPDLLLQYDADIVGLLLVKHYKKQGFAASWDVDSLNLFVGWKEKERKGK